MAKFNFKSQIIKRRDGSVYTKTVPSGKKGEADVEVDMTMADLLSLNLTADNPEATPTERYQCYKLAQRIESEPEVTLTIEETALVKKVTGRHPNPYIMGLMWDALEKESEGKK